MFILHLGYSEHFIFFGWDDEWGANIIMNFSLFTIVKFVLEKLDRTLGLTPRGPPPLVGTNPKFFEKLDLKAPLSFNE